MVKVETKEPVKPFRSIVITLETPEEADALHHALNYCGGEHYLNGPFGQGSYKMSFKQYNAERTKLWEAIGSVHTLETRII